MTSSDVDPKAASAFTAEFGAKTYTGLQDLIDAPRVDVVDLILPHHLHYDAAMAVLDAGKHLILEKPVAPTYEQSAAIQRRAAEAGVHFMVAENSRYIAAYQAVHRLPNEGAAEVYGRMRSGAHFSCGFTSVSEVPHSERLELYGTEGGILVDQISDPVVKIFRGQHDYRGEAVAGVPFGPDAWHPGGWHYESVITEVTDYVRALVEGRPPLIDSGDAVYAMRVVEAAYESIQSGKTVTLPAGAQL
ncbi:Gfo/Idh/MocA family protein [Nonomuraea sp. NPDC049684]|uniref:Gfo/Idh/MocA family protein n=1 Tax=Nonomuraea sp. NPDC049684 TaxID=3364356 RepID=UPI0037BB1C1F